MILKMELLGRILLKSDLVPMIYTLLCKLFDYDFLTTQDFIIFITKTDNITARIFN